MAFDKKRLINLDQCVLNALDLFMSQKLPDIDIRDFRRPLVVGSGNAAATGKILFDGKDAVFADESDYLRKLNTIAEIDGCVLISASGGKHAPIIAAEVKRRGLRLVLLTNNKDAEAMEMADSAYVFPKNMEPYTYNTSTYLGLVLSKTKEDPKMIREFLLKLKVPDFRGFDAFYFLVPEEFDLAREMFATKFDELFGPKISVRVFTPSQTKHAKTVVASDKELFIGLGYENRLFGTRRINFRLPGDAGYGTAIAAGYYIIGIIQKQNRPYFKQNIEAYAKKASKMFGSEIKPIVE